MVFPGGEHGHVGPLNCSSMQTHLHKVHMDMKHIKQNNMESAVHCLERSDSEKIWPCCGKKGDLGSRRALAA